MPVLLAYGEKETRKLTTLIINDAVTKELSSNLIASDLYKVEKDLNGEVKLITYNSVNVTKILSSVTNLIEFNLKSIEEGNLDLNELPNTQFNGYDKKLLKQGIVYEIPAFVVTSNFFLANLGPKIPLKLSFVGDVVSNIQTKVTEYGLNNALIEVGVYIEVSTKINLPYVSKNIKISNVVPISINIIDGKVPDSYFNGITYTSDGQIIKDTLK